VSREENGLRLVLIAQPAVVEVVLDQIGHRMRPVEHHLGNVTLIRIRENESTLAYDPNKVVLIGCYDAVSATTKIAAQLGVEIIP
jgi:hypothetical protein